MDGLALIRICRRMTVLCGLLHCAPGRAARALREAMALPSISNDCRSWAKG